MQDLLSRIETALLDTYRYSFWDSKHGLPRRTAFKAWVRAHDYVLGDRVTGEILLLAREVLDEQRL